MQVMKIAICVSHEFSFDRLMALTRLFEAANEALLATPACHARYELAIVSRQGGIVASSTGVSVLTLMIGLDTARAYRHVVREDETEHAVLGLVRRDGGEALAATVARLLRQPDSPRHADRLGNTDASSKSERIGAGARWITENAHKPIRIAQAAEVASMSERTFLRQFRQLLGCSPLEYLLQQRLERCRRLLVETELPIDKIARHCGMSCGSQLSRTFKACFSISPSEYRGLHRAPRPEAAPAVHRPAREFRVPQLMAEAG